VFRLLSARKIGASAVALVCTLWHASFSVDPHHISSRSIHAETKRHAVFAEVNQALPRLRKAIPDLQPYSLSVEQIAEANHNALGTLRTWFDLDSDGVAYAATVSGVSKFKFVVPESDIPYTVQVQRLKAAAQSSSKTSTLPKAKPKTKEPLDKLAAARSAQNALPQTPQLQRGAGVLSQHKQKDEPSSQSIAETRDRLQALLDGGRLEGARGSLDLDDDARIVREKQFSIPMGEDVGLLVESRINDDLEQGRSIGVGLGLNFKF
jgi:hypothetical protein